MTSAFQVGAFQSGAFQLEAGVVPDNGSPGVGRGRPRIYVYRYEPEDPPKPVERHSRKGRKNKPKPIRRTVTADALAKALGQAPDLAALLTPAQALAVAPERIEYTPQPATDLGGDQLLVLAIIAALRAELQQRLMDEELAIVMLLAA